MLLILLTLWTPGVHADVERMRNEYRAALADLNAARLADFRVRRERLQNYALLPYLEYALLMRYISRASPEDIADFRERWADTPLADRALRQWLENLARRGEWQLYLEHHDPEIATAARYRCRLARAQLATGAADDAWASARDLWLLGRSQSDACDPLFANWRNGPGIPDELVWQRLVLALEEGNLSLARYLQRDLDEASLELAQSALSLHRRPGRLGGLQSLPGGDGGPREVRVITNTLLRLARTGPDMAQELLQREQTRLAFPEHDLERIRAAILRGHLRNDPQRLLATRAWPPSGVPREVSDAVSEEIALAAIRAEDWDALSWWIGVLPSRTRSEGRWRYWQARVLERDASGALPPLGQHDPEARHPGVERAHAALRSLALERSFHGFLAALHLGLPPMLDASDTALAESERSSIAARPGLQRALELRALGELGDARREINVLISQLDDAQLLALSHHLASLGWHRQSIQATISAESWNELALRFPLAWEMEFRHHAQENEIDLPWAFAVARQESAFMPDALSPSGAIGVMQLMPATATATARRLGLRMRNRWHLVDPTFNIRLGTSYLARMHRRFGANRVIATAAYNAGPTRVSGWLETRENAHVDAWIESIPLRETRNYVQNVLAFATIYAGILGQPETPVLTEDER